MSAELPDDMAAWPDDPFALLGVPRGAADRDIRVAYTRLIRRFKPERFPEQFQRIREAYDRCRSQSHWYREEPASEPAAASELPAWSPPEPPPPDEIDRLWQQAVAGSEADAYAGLMRERRNSPRPDIPLRLYWLLALNPEFDADRTRHEWLRDALDCSKLSGGAIELYRRELDVDPLAALCGAYDDLLTADAESGDRIAVARHRVNAAGRHCHHRILHRDLQTLKPRLGGDHEIAWLSLLVSAIEWTYLKDEPPNEPTWNAITGAASNPSPWTSPSDLRSYCLEELNELDHLGLEHGFFFDRVEASAVWTDVTRYARRVRLPEEFVQLVQSGWTLYGADSRAAVRAAVAKIAAEPAKYLARFDDFDFASKTKTWFFEKAVQTLERHHEASSEEFPPELLRALLRPLLAGSEPEDDRVRYAVLKRMIDDGIHPDELAEACAADPERRFRKLGKRLGADQPLRIVWLCCAIVRQF